MYSTLVQAGEKPPPVAAAQVGDWVAGPTQPMLDPALHPLAKWQLRKV